MSETIPTYVADHELATLLKAAAGSGRRVRVEAGGEVWEITISPASKSGGIAEEHDPEASRETWEAIAGIRPDIDADAWIRQIKEDREQDTPARRFP